MLIRDIIISSSIFQTTVMGSQPFTGSGVASHGHVSTDKIIADIKSLHHSLQSVGPAGASPPAHLNLIESILDGLISLEPAECNRALGCVHTAGVTNIDFLVLNPTGGARSRKTWADTAECLRCLAHVVGYSLSEDEMHYITTYLGFKGPPESSSMFKITDGALGAKLGHFIKYVAFKRRLMEISSSADASKYEYISLMLSKTKCRFTPEIRLGSKFHFSNAETMIEICDFFETAGVHMLISDQYFTVAQHLKISDLTDCISNLKYIFVTPRYVSPISYIESFKTFLNTTWPLISTRATGIKVSNFAGLPSRLFSYSFVHPEFTQTTVSSFEVAGDMSVEVFDFIITRLGMQQSLRSVSLTGNSNPAAIVEYIRSRRMPLAELELINSNISEIPDLSDFKDTLIGLDLSHNDLSSGIDWRKIASLSRLEYLRLEMCRIKSLEPVQEDAVNTNIISLDISNNLLKEFPACVFTVLPNIRYIYMRNNEMHSLNISLDGPSHLSYIELCQNGVEKTLMDPNIINGRIPSPTLDLRANTASQTPSVKSTRNIGLLTSLLLLTVAIFCCLMLYLYLVFAGLRR